MRFVFNKFNDNSSKFLFFKKKETKDLNSSDVELVDDFQIERPTLLVFGGNPTTNIEEVKRYSRIVRNWISNDFYRYNGKKFDIVCAMYNGGNILKDQGLVSPTYDFGALAETLFKPLIANGDEKMSFETAKRNLRKVTMFGHSAGSLVVNRTMSEFEDIIHKCGYTDKERKELLNQICFVGFSPYEIVDSQIKALHIAPIEDSMYSWFKELQYLKAKNGISLLSAKEAKAELIKIRSDVKKNGYCCFDEEFDGSENHVAIIPGPLTKVSGFDDHAMLGVVKSAMGNPYTSDVGKRISGVICDSLEEMVRSSISVSSVSRKKEIDLHGLVNDSLGNK